MNIRTWWHHFTNPHCADCMLERAEAKECKSCNTLQIALDHAEYRNRELLQTIIELTKPKVETVSIPYMPELEAVKPSVTPWRVKRAELEANDRATAKLMRDKEKEMAEANKDFTVKVDPTARPTVEELEKILELEGEKENV